MEPIGPCWVKNLSPNLSYRSGSARGRDFCNRRSASQLSHTSGIPASSHRTLLYESYPTEHPD